MMPYYWDCYWELYIKYLPNYLSIIQKYCQKILWDLLEFTPNMMIFFCVWILNQRTLSFNEITRGFSILARRNSFRRTLGGHNTLSDSHPRTLNKVKPLSNFRRALISSSLYCCQAHGVPAMLAISWNSSNDFQMLGWIISKWQTWLCSIATWLTFTKRSAAVFWSWLLER